MFFSNIRKIMYTPVNPRGSKLYRRGFVMSMKCGFHPHYRQTVSASKQAHLHERSTEKKKKKKKHEKEKDMKLLSGDSVQGIRVW